MNLFVQKPVFTKNVTSTGTEHIHTFALESDIVFRGNGLPTQSPAEVLQTMLQHEGAVQLQAFLTEFLRLTTQYFAKPYTVANILKNLKHDTEPSTANGQLHFSPKAIQISSRGFLIQWRCEQEEEEALIRLPDTEEEDNEIGDIDAIPLAATNEVIQLQTPNLRHIYDRQRVKEANLRAKLAQYKANRAHLEYLEKYGNAPSDSSSDSETDNSDDSE
jgi:hypothetical protein